METYGLPEEIYTLKPAKNSNFQNSYIIKTAFKQPQNFREEIQEIIYKLLTRLKEGN